MKLQADAPAVTTMLADRLAHVRARIVDAAARAGRDPADVTLVAVSKLHDLDALRDAYALGVRDFGEARVDEMREKAVRMPDDARWHFIGALQSNKLARVREVAHLVHSFDRPDRAEAWVRGDAPSPPVLLQVNLAREPQKRGVAPDAVVDALRTLVAAGVDVRGLMALPPRAEDEAAARGHVRALRALRDEARAKLDLPLPELSVGMSADLEAAVEEGATLVRVGTALFGARPARA